MSTVPPQCMRPTGLRIGTRGRTPAHGATEQVWFTLDCNGADRGNHLCGKCVHPKAMVIECLSAGGGRVNVTGTLASRSAVTLDLDGDGDVDIVTNEFNARPQVLMSDLAQRRRINYLEIRLRGTRSNREGLGPAARACAGGR